MQAEEIAPEEPKQDQEIEENKINIENIDDDDQQNKSNPPKLIPQYPFEKGGKILDDFHCQIFD